MFQKTRIPPKNCPKITKMRSVWLLDAEKVVKSVLNSQKIHWLNSKFTFLENLTTILAGNFDGFSRQNTTTQGCM